MRLLAYSVYNLALYNTTHKIACGTTCEWLYEFYDAMWSHKQLRKELSGAVEQLVHTAATARSLYPQSCAIFGKWRVLSHEAWVFNVINIQGTRHHRSKCSSIWLKSIMLRCCGDDICICLIKCQHFVKYETEVKSCNTFERIWFLK